MESDDSDEIHQQLASALDQALSDIHAIRSEARSSLHLPVGRRWSMIIFKTPKGWTGPKFVDGKTVECTWRTHQVPIADFKNPELSVVRVFGTGSGLK